MMIFYFIFYGWPLFSVTASRPTLRPTQAPVRLVPRAPSRVGGNQAGRKVPHLHLVPCMELYLHSPIRLYGAVVTEAQRQLCVFVNGSFVSCNVIVLTV
jgi:hypothetical protein